MRLPRPRPALAQRSDYQRRPRSCATCQMGQASVSLVPSIRCGTALRRCCPLCCKAHSSLCLLYMKQYADSPLQPCSHFPHSSHSTRLLSSALPQIREWIRAAQPGTVVVELDGPALASVVRSLRGRRQQRFARARLRAGYVPSSFARASYTSLLTVQPPNRGPCCRKQAAHAPAVLGPAGGAQCAPGERRRNGSALGVTPWSADGAAGSQPLK